MSLPARLAVLLACLAPFGLRADLSQRFGPYDIHYSAVLTAALLPEIAQRYGITSSNHQALITVSVLKAGPDPGGQPVPASVSGYARNLAAQTKDLEFREIRDKGWVYYLAEVPVTDREVLDFNLKVKPQGAAAPFAVSFQRKFFEEPAAPYMRPGS